MEALVSLLNVLNTLSPLAVIALLALVLFMQAKNAKHVESARNEVETLRTNDLHEMPDILATLQRIEVKLGEEFAHIRARLNGGPK